jgi:hypothetical protein
MTTALTGASLWWLLDRRHYRLCRGWLHEIAERSPRAVLAVLLLAMIPVATTVPSLAALGGIDALLWAMIAYETANYDERRYRLRHGLDPDPETPLGGERT